MKYKVEFQHKSLGNLRPDDEVQDDAIQFDSGQFIPIPNVGDSVGYNYGGQLTYFKVISRHFEYVPNWCVVMIVVTDLSDEEMESRLKM